MITTVTGRNQVTIPAEVVKRAGLRTGSRLDWSFDEKRRELHVKIQVSRGELARRIMGAGRKYLKPGEDPVADLIGEREQDDAEENRSGDIS